MTRTKIVIYLALIFLAGAIAGGAIVLSSWQTFAPERRPRPHGSPEDFANHIWNQLKERLNLTPEQAIQIEPIFRGGFDEVRTIQDRTLQEVEAAIRKNHEQISAFLSDEQKEELQKMNEERREFLKHRGHASSGSKPPSKTPPQ